jgi:predicted DCC family thiol-disulfide oxidoreductase YuxK
MLPNNEHPVLYFDGACNLCNSSVRFIMSHAPNKLFQFVTLQSPAGEEALSHFAGQAPDSLILYYNGTYFTKSDAALRIAKLMKGMWPLLYGFIIMPRFLRDAVYDFIARNRYKWFGKNDVCGLP